MPTLSLSLHKVCGNSVTIFHLPRDSLLYRDMRTWFCAGRTLEAPSELSIAGRVSLLLPGHAAGQPVTTTSIAAVQHDLHQQPARGSPARPLSASGPRAVHVLPESSPWSQLMSRQCRRCRNGRSELQETPTAQPPILRLPQFGPLRPARSPRWATRLTPRPRCTVVLLCVVVVRRCSVATWWGSKAANASWFWEG